MILLAIHPSSVRRWRHAITASFPLVVFVGLSISALLFVPQSVRGRFPGKAAFWDPVQPFAARFLLEPREVDWYYEEGTWFLRGFLPYRDYPYEYPVLATALFTLPALLNHDPVAYQVFFRVLMAAAGIVLIALTVRAVRQQGKIAAAWLLLLPSVFYAMLNRFDVFPALFLQASLLLLFSRHFRASWILLALAFLFKWYAGLLLPLYLFVLFDHARERGARVRAFQGLLAGVFLVAVGHLWIIPAGGGLLDMVNPYAIHFVRPPEIGSLPAAVLAFLHPQFQVFDPDALPPHSVAVALVTMLSTVLQLMGLVWILVSVVRNPRTAQWVKLPRLALAAFIVVGSFVLFSRVYSHQWVVWLAPLLALTVPRRAWVYASFIAFDVLNYLQFPMRSWLTEGGSSSFLLFSHVTLARSLLLGVLLMMAARAFVQGRSGADEERNMATSASSNSLVQRGEVASAW